MMREKFSRWLRRSGDPVSDVLLWVITIGVYGTLFLALVVGSKFFFPFIVLKNVLFRMIVEVIVVCYIALAIRNPRFRPRWNALTIAVLAYFGVVTLTTFTGIEPFWSIWGNYERMGGLFGMWHLAAFFFILVNTFRRWQDWRSLFTFSIFISLLMSVFSFGQWLQVPFLLKSSGGSRLTGTIGNATYLAAYLLIHLFLIGYFWWRDREFDVRLFFWSLIGADVALVGYDLFARSPEAATTLLEQLFTAPARGLISLIVALQVITAAAYFLRRNRWAVRGFLTALGLLNFFIFYQTQTRGAFIGLLVGAMLIAIVGAAVRRRQVIGKVSLALLGLCLLAPIAIVLARNTAFVKNDLTLARLSSISLADVTSQSRLDTWRASWQGWTDDPVRFVIGYGLENYGQVFNKHFPPRIFKELGSQIWFDRAHNIVFDTAVTSGLIGLLSYLAIFGIVGWMLVRYYRHHHDLFGAVLPGALLAAYFIQNLFVFDQLDSFILFYLLLAAIVCRTQHATAVSVTAADAPLPLVAYQPLHIGAITSAALVAAYSLYVFNYQLLAANHKIYQALLTFRNPDPAQQRVLFAQAIDGSNTGRFEARQQLASFSMSLAQSGAAPEVVRPILQAALDELKKSVLEEPTNIRNHLFFASFANRATIALPDAAQQAIEVLQPAVPLSPTRPQVYFELGQAYLLLGDNARALEMYRQGLSYSSHVIESQTDMIVAYLLTNNADLALAQIPLAEVQTSRKFPPEQYLRMIRTAERIEQWAVAARLYELLIADHPPMADWYAKLATDYAKAGDKDKATAAAQKAVELDPNMRADFDAFIKNLKQK